LPDLQDTRVEVDVDPTRTETFALAKSMCNGYRPAGGQQAAIRGAEQLPSLGASQRHYLGSPVAVPPFRLDRLAG